MKLLKLLFLMLSLSLFFSCSVELMNDLEEDDDDSVVRYNGDYMHLEHEYLYDTYWEVIVDKWDGRTVVYPTTLDYLQESDPDNDGMAEFVNLHTYYHFNFSEITVYNRKVIVDNGIVQGEFEKSLEAMGALPESDGIYPVITDFRMKIKDGVGHITGSEGEDFLYYNGLEIILMYEDNGREGETILRRVRREDIK